MELSLLVLPAFIIWFIILVLPWRPWSTRESLEGDPSITKNLSVITVLIPARNEATVINETLNALAEQDNNLNVILIDDLSTDETVSRASQSGLKNLEIITGQPLPEGWSGKLWALEQGRKLVKTPYLLLLDADIKLQPGTIAALQKKMEAENLDMVSLMAFLRMQGFWEQLLMPAFIYFFKLLYPFSLSNNPKSFVAAAAGGCILIKQNILENTGGFEPFKNNLIDDCALAKRIKKNGGTTWIGLTHSAVSLRCYDNLQVIWDMVARTAYTQLRYSITLLILCTLLMTLAFLLPVFAIVLNDIWTKIIAVATLCIMLFTYIPVLKFYSVNYLWGLLLPFTGLLYLLMTLSSAYRHYFSVGSAWKDRHYAISE